MQTRSSHENSVRPSAKRVNCDKTKEKLVQIFIPYERSFGIVFWEKNGWWKRPPEIVGQSDRFGAKSPILNRYSASAVTPSEKSSINTNI